jgi:hypothetical protein
LAAQTGRFRYTSAILPVAAGLAGCAYQRLQQGEPRTVASTSTGLLLGWTSVASVVNVFATRRRGRLAPTTATGRGAATVAVLGAAAGWRLWWPAADAGTYRSPPRAGGPS